MKKYIVQSWSRGFNEPAEEKFKKYEDAKKYYDDYLALQGGDIKIRLIKIKKLEFSDYCYDEE